MLHIWPTKIYFISPCILILRICVFLYIFLGICTCIYANNLFYILLYCKVHSNFTVHLLKTTPTTVSSFVLFLQLFSIKGGRSEKEERILAGEKSEESKKLGERIKKKGIGAREF